MTIPSTTIKALLEQDLKFEHRMAMHMALSEQIWREQNLVSPRMTWNLTFQGMLVAIYVFAGSSFHGWMSPAVQIALGVCGALACVAVYYSIRAAQNQSGRLKEHWVVEFCEPRANVDTCNVQTGPFPQPFSPKTHSVRGRWASRGICLILFGLWGVLVAFSLVHLVFTHDGEDADPAPCTVSRKAGDQGITLDCPQLKSPRQRETMPWRPGPHASLPLWSRTAG